MTYNEFEGKPLRLDQPLYKDQTSGPQSDLSLETVFMEHSQLNHRHMRWEGGNKYVTIPVLEYVLVM